MPSTACGSTPSGGVRYTFDDNGSQVGNTAGQQISYDTADRATSMKRPGGTALTATYAGASQYDRRTTGAVAFTPSLLGVSVRAGEFSRTDYYTRDTTGGLVGRRWGTTTTTKDYYLFDGLGSVVALVDGTGVVIRRYDYDPYGVTTPTDATGTPLADPATDTNPWRFTGEYQDRLTGLYKIGHRYLQPDLGRWTQRDPLQHRINPAQPGEHNPYSYVGCNPVNYTDPTGRNAWDYVKSCVIGAAVGALLAIYTGGISLFAIVAGCLQDVAVQAVIDVLGLEGQVATATDLTVTLTDVFYTLLKATL
jgi:RHS repeat-associated protein